MPAEIAMPQQTDTMTEGTVVKWLKKEGDKVTMGETIAEIETDKAVMEMAGSADGTLAVIVAREGDKVAVGATIGVLAVGKESPADVKKQFAAKPSGMNLANSGQAPAATADKAHAAPAGKESGPTGIKEVGASQGASGARHPDAHATGPRTFAAASTDEMRESASTGHGATRSVQPTAAVAEGSESSQEEHGAGNGNGQGGRIFASPLARRIAQDKGVDLSQLQGSGPGGRIVQRDVMEYAGRPKQSGQSAGKLAAAGASLPARIARGQQESVPLSKMRSAIAKGLQKSKQNIPHFYVTVDIDVEEISQLRGRINESLKTENIKLSLSDFVTKTAAAALLRHPAMNAHFDAESNQIVRFGDVHLGIAVAIPDGLIVPVLRNVDQMGLKEIRLRSEDLIGRARGQKLKQDEMRGATFTVSNLGALGVREFSAIINPPEVAILAIAGAEKRPVVRGGAIVPRTMMSVTLSADHRAVDGATAAQFLRTLKELLEEPAMMLV
ncbi:MAG TPA: dihydrolipoamide acetyltransferase family protein [Tepidisphaeraceae bacterium]|nr:dihydrolipoamide acetyltransferase family protein [Tepidisphaeraceae bacterium]